MSQRKAEKKACGMARGLGIERRDMTFGGLHKKCGEPAAGRGSEHHGLSLYTRNAENQLPEGL